MTWERIEDAPVGAEGMLVGVVESLDGTERSVCIQVDRVRVVVDPAEARGMAEAIVMVADMVESGARIPGEHHVEQDAPRSELERITAANRRALGLEGRGN